MTLAILVLNILRSLSEPAPVDLTIAVGKLSQQLRNTSQYKLHFQFILSAAHSGQLSRLPPLESRTMKEADTVQ